MNCLLLLTFAGIFSLALAQTGGNTASTRQVLLDVLNKLMSQTGPSSNFKLDTKPSPPPMPFFKPSNPFLPAPFPVGPQLPSGSQNPNDGLFMDMPSAGGAYGGAGGYMAQPMRSYHYCPPGPTTADHCKDQKLQEALYFPDGTPRYNWVPPRNPWDTSLPDTVKDTARNILMMKVNSRPNRTPTPKEWELMSMLGDPKELGPAGANPFG